MAESPQTLPRISNKKDFYGRLVLVRSGLNVPIKNGVVADTFRVKKALDTIKYLSRQKAKVIIIAHIGREADASLYPVFQCMQKLLPLSFVDSIVDDKARTAIEQLRDGEVIMLENVRRYPEESANDEHFARQLASLADVYVDDAFSAAHRKHASIVGVPRFISGYAGLLFENELEHLSRAFKPVHPSILILGGAKFATKEPLVRKFLGSYDKVFIGGALAHAFFKAKGWEIGKSLLSDEAADVADILNNKHILLPRDVIVRTKSGSTAVKHPKDVHSEDTIFDAGPETVAELSEIVRSANFVLWNGPLGNYEQGFCESTEQLARTLSDSGAYSIVGGGDTVASIANLRLEEKFSFVSTGGGAMLQFLTDGTLPGVEALMQSPS